MLNRLLLLLALLLPFSIACAGSVSGSGARSCGDFIGYINTEDQAGVDSFISWAQGFISAINWVEGRDLQIDAGGLTYALVNECGNTPGKRFYEAVIGVVRRYR